MPQQQSEFDRMFAIAQNEIHRDAPRIAKNLDLSAGATQQSEQEMLGQVQRNWSNPQFRQWLFTAYAPDQAIGLYLKAANVTNPDGTPMTVNQYQKQVFEPFMQNGQHATFGTQPVPEALAPAGVHQPDETTAAIANAAPASAAAPDTAPATQPMPIAPGGAQQ